MRHSDTVLRLEMVATFCEIKGINAGEISKEKT